MDKQVSFIKQSRVIGKGSYEIDSDVDIKRVKNRPPTPTESLTSVGKQPYVEKLTNNVSEHYDDDDEDEEEDEKEHEFIAELPLNAKIFVEHLFVRFKRRVVIGVGRIVLECLCHFKNTQGLEIMNKSDFLSMVWYSLSQ